MAKLKQSTVGDLATALCVPDVPKPEEPPMSYVEKVLQSSVRIAVVFRKGRC